MFKFFSRKKEIPAAGVTDIHVSQEKGERVVLTTEATVHTTTPPTSRQNPAVSLATSRVNKTLSESTKAPDRSDYTALK